MTAPDRDPLAAHLWPTESGHRLTPKRCSELMPTDSDCDCGERQYQRLRRAALAPRPPETAATDAYGAGGFDADAGWESPETADAGALDAACVRCGSIVVPMHVSPYTGPLDGDGYPDHIAAYRDATPALDVDVLAASILSARSTTAMWKGSARATAPTRWDRIMAKRVAATYTFGTAGDDHLHVFEERQLVEAGHGPVCRQCGFEAPPFAAESPTPEPAKLIVWAVVFSNYDPPETDSIWQKEEDAQKRCDELNVQSGNSAWDIHKWTIQ